MGKRYEEMHGDHVWDNARGFYAGIVWDEDDMEEVLRRLNADQSDPEVELKALRDEGKVWGAEV